VAGPPALSGYSHILLPTPKNYRRFAAWPVENCLLIIVELGTHTMGAPRVASEQPSPRGFIVSSLLSIIETNAYGIAVFQSTKNSAASWGDPDNER
jgi:hypothetical protein